MSEQLFQRKFVHLRGKTPGPLVLVSACLHGNEQAGRIALERVSEELLLENACGENLCGQVIGLLGNLEALKKQVRSIDADLNRIWTKERMECLREGRVFQTNWAEDREQRELYEGLREVLADADQASGVYFLDIHTFSAEGPPLFLSCEQRESLLFAEDFPVTTVFPVEKFFSGLLIGEMASKASVSLIFEGGQHEGEKTIQRIEAALWFFLGKAGVLGEECEERISSARAMLEGPSGNISSRLEVFYRYHIQHPGKYKTEPGFQNFDPVFAGQQIAMDGEAKVFAPADGRILFPLYQEQGEDGFFLVEER